MFPPFLNPLCRVLLISWLLLVVVLPCLWTIALHIVPFAFAGFQASSHHGLAIAHSMAKGTLWLIPTSFLVLLYWWIRANSRPWLPG